MSKLPAVYILASSQVGTLYVGVTSNLVQRVWQHRNGLIAGFTKQYKVHRLVWYEIHPTMESAIEKEKRLKRWKRQWKIDLVDAANPGWEDLYPDISDQV